MDFDRIIDEIGKMYNYSDELVEALKKCVPAMAKGKSKPEIQLIIDTLKRVEIYTFNEQPTEEQIDEIEKSKINGRNNHVTENGLDLGEYGKSVGAGAYHSFPIFDEKMNIVDRVGFIHLTNLSENSDTAKFQGSLINYSHLIHELGHAVAAQKDEFVQSENGNYIHNIGAVSFSYIVDRDNCSTEQVGETGLYLEEGINTIEEECVLCELFEVESIKDIPGYVPSVYHGLMSDTVAAYIQQIGSLPFSKLRNFKDDSDLRPYMEIIAKTEVAQELNNPDFYDSKRATFDRVLELEKISDDEKMKLKTYFDEYSDVYYNPHIQGDFLQRLNNVLNQMYNFGLRRGYFPLRSLNFDDFSVTLNEKNIEIYNEVVTKIIQEAYVPLKQASKEIESYNNEKNKISIESLAKQAMACEPQRQEFQDCQIHEDLKEIDQERKEIE